MSRTDAAWLTDVLASIDAITGYLAAGSLDEGVVYDACRARLIEIGEATKHLPSELTDKEIARMRDQLAHRYFDTDHTIVAEAVTERLPALREAVERLIG